MKKKDIENIELDLLLEGIYKRYGYDFRDYAKASIIRRINLFLKKSNYTNISELLPKILYDDVFFEDLIYQISVPVTEMFRDPEVYKKIREIVIPHLKNYSFIKIWHAGCASGEEVYSLAILLKEEGLYDRCQIYGTDFNELALAKAKDGVFSIEKIKQHTLNYQKAGGQFTFSNYYHSEYDFAIINRDLKKNITFSNHNLATDTIFGEMDFILCRNVLIYFNTTLQNRVLNILKESLATNGFLCLGAKESIKFSEVESYYNTISNKEKIYQIK